MQDNGTIVHFRYLHREDDIKRSGETLKIKFCADFTPRRLSSTYTASVTEKAQVGSLNVLCLRQLGLHEKSSALLESPAYADGMIDFVLRCVT